MSHRVYTFRKPRDWRDRRQLERTLLALAAEYEGLVLDRFITENLFYFGWTPFEIRRTVSALLKDGKLVGKVDADGALVLCTRQLELSEA